MRIISEDNLCVNRTYINLKKLTMKTSIRKGYVTEAGLKGTYIIDQNNKSLCKNNNYTIHFSNGIEKMNFDTNTLNGMLLVEVNYSCRTGGDSAKFKAYIILNNIKYALAFNAFEDVYNDIMSILEEEIKDKEELSYIKAGFNNLEIDEAIVDIHLNLERLSEFTDKVNYKRNVDYFVINNIASATSKYDIKNKTNIIKTTDTIKVLRYNYNNRLYSLLTSNNDGIIELRDSDIICTLGDYTNENNFPTVSIYTEYGLGKLLDIKNNVIPTANTISLFANILDLGLDVLN